MSLRRVVVYYVMERPPSISGHGVHESWVFCWVAMSKFGVQLIGISLDQANWCWVSCEFLFDLYSSICGLNPCSPLSGIVNMLAILSLTGLIVSSFV